MAATTSTVITAASFPTPDLAKRTSDPVELARVAEFADQQAAAAESVRARLAADWPTLDRWGRMTALRGANAELVAWRHALALRAPHRLGRGIPLDASRFITPIDDDNPNYDRLGYLGRLRTGSTWDPGSRLYVGGETTPAHEVMLHYGQAAVDRINAEAPGKDVLFNPVVLPGGTRRLFGNRLVRGAAGRQVADMLVARVAARGGNTSTMEVGGDPVYAVTATPDHAGIMFDVALSVLAGAYELDPLPRLRAWQDARYLLYQSPRFKKGSDAVTRVVLVAVGALLFGRAPVLAQDVDLRCMVLGQRAATEMDGDTALVRA